jgi:hypothetical protein
VCRVAPLFTDEKPAVAGLQCAGFHHAPDCTLQELPARSLHVARGTDRALQNAVLDVVFIIATVAFFAVAVVYVRACDRL